MHTSRQYEHTLEVLGGAFDQDRDRLPNLIVKLGGGTTDDIRATIADNLAPLGLESITIGQLNPVGQLADDLVSGGPMIAELQQIREEGRIGRFVLEIFPWTM